MERTGLSGGITEVVETKYMTHRRDLVRIGESLARRSSWPGAPGFGRRVGLSGQSGYVLAVFDGPDDLFRKWQRRAKPHMAQISACWHTASLEISIVSNPEYACFFVYGKQGIHQKKLQRRFWEFVDNPVWASARTYMFLLGYPPRPEISKLRRLVVFGRSSGRGVRSS